MDRDELRCSMRDLEWSLDATRSGRRWGDRREMAEPEAERVGFMLLMNTVEPMQPVLRADELEGYWERRVF